MRSVVRFGVIGAAVFVLGLVPQGFAQTVTTALFPRVVVGGGYTTTFTLMNTGSTALTGSLILTLQKSDGTTPNVTVTDPVLNQSTPYSGTSITVLISSLPSGGTRFLSAASTNPGDSAAVGWSQVNTSGGTLGGVATFAFTSGGQLQTIVGVLSSDLVSSATIPVNDDFSQSRYTGYAVANPGSSTITIKVETVNADGSTGTTLTTISLAAGQQTAGFVYLDQVLKNQSATWKFQGSVVLIGQNGATFSVVALVLQGSLLTAIPVIPSKSPIIN
jgi:hypothetical protein